jgi:hypothetical protein
MLDKVVFEYGVTPANRYVADTHIRFMSPAEFEGRVLLVRHNQVDHARGIFLEGKRFEPQEFPIVLRHVNIYQTIFTPVRLENVGIRFFANLTFELFPGVGDKIAFFFLLHLLFQPMFQALVMDEAN